MKRWVCLMGAALSLATAVRADGPAPVQPWRDAEWINAGWLYLERTNALPPSDPASAWTKVDLPHTWNAKDTLETAKYRRGVSWYRRDMALTKADLAQRIFLRFGAAGQRAEVFVNGKEELAHAGGYSAFTLEITKLAQVGANRIDVRVSNAPDTYLAPLSGDFNMYGGLYRGVQLLRAPTCCIARARLGGPGVRVWSDKVSADAAVTMARVQIDNAGEATDVVVVAELTSPEGHPAARVECPIQAPSGAVTPVALKLPRIDRPELWSPESPKLYTLTVRLMSGGNEIDRVTVRHGFRWYAFDGNKGFSLNGRPYRLLGVNRHQDLRGYGNAVPLEHHLRDVRLMKEVGANFVRLAHYQQDDYVLQLCDELGLLVWEEVPYVNGTTFEPAFQENLLSMLRDLIEQHFNHPSVIVWGLGNEVWLKKGDDGKAKDYPVFEALNVLAHREDPTRKTAIVSGDINTFIDMKVMNIPDIAGYNLYRGWYGGGYETFTARVNDLRQRLGNKPLVITEFGAGADPSIHSETPKRFDFSEEYQVEFLAAHLDQLDRMPWLCGFNWWVFADFGAAHRTDSNPHINNKGFLTFDRTKKDIFQYVKARWTRDPVLYLCSPSWTHRTGAAKKTYRVFTNLERVELFHQGRSLGVQTNGFIWDVTLEPGRNTLLARGGQLNHGFDVTYAPSAAKYVVNADKFAGLDKPENAVDEDPSTRWAAEIPAALEVDLGRIALVEGVVINFHKAVTRSYKFAVETSVDGKTWTRAFDGVSTKGAAQPELFVLDQRECRHVRIRGLGNNENDWIAINELEIRTGTEKKNKDVYEKIGSGAAK